MRITDRAICLARSARYSAYEPLRLRWERHRHGKDGIRNPLISVIIPTHNRCGLLLNRALPSVLNQTYRNIEVLVCAHGCTDRTVARVRSKMDHRIRVIEVPRRRTYPPTAENHWFAGPVDPINAGLKKARGAWIARIDDDDEWTPDHLEKLLRFAQLGNYEFVSSAYLRHHIHGAVEAVEHDKGKPPIGGVQTWVYRSHLRFMKANPDCWRKSWNRVNDTDLADRFRKAGVRIGHLNAITASIKPRPGESEIGLKAYTRDRAATERKYAFR